MKPLISKEKFTTADIVDAVKISPSSVKYYILNGVVVPEVALAGGRGVHRKFSKKNLFEFAIVKELNLLGITVGTIRTALSYLNKKHNLADEKWIEKERPALVIYKDAPEKTGSSTEGFTMIVQRFVEGGPEGDCLLGRGELEGSYSAVVVDLYKLLKKIS